jgi:hypothetical protein
MRVPSPTPLVLVPRHRLFIPGSFVHFIVRVHGLFLIRTPPERLDSKEVSRMVQTPPSVTRWIGEDDPEAERWLKKTQAQGWVLLHQWQSPRQSGRYVLLGLDPY